MNSPYTDLFVAALVRGHAAAYPRVTLKLRIDATRFVAAMRQAEAAFAGIAAASSTAAKRIVEARIAHERSIARARAAGLTAADLQKAQRAARTGTTTFEQELDRLVALRIGWKQANPAPWVNVEALRKGHR